jgi:L-lactate dehydrogenase
VVIGAHCCVTQLLERRGERFDVTRSRLEQEVRYANITIIEGHDASQYGIGMRRRVSPK